MAKYTGPCIVEGCTKTGRRIRKMCGMHYTRLFRNGTTDTMPTLGRRIWRTKNDSGYIVLTLPNGRRVREHRYLMEQKLGRELLTSETVHHKNGVRDDNRLGNLELWSTSHPPGQKVSDKVTWAKEILKLYGDL